MTTATDQLVRGGGIMRGQDVKDIFDRRGAYPSAGVRTVSSLNNYLNALEPMDALVEDSIDPEEIRHFKALNVMIYLAERYAEFALMLFVTRVREPDLQTERKAIHYGESAAQLRKDCAPFAFGGLLKPAR